MNHFIIAAKLGEDKSLQAVTKTAFRDGYVSKDDFEAALRCHKAAVDATKSPQREEADEFRRNYICAEKAVGIEIRNVYRLFPSCRTSKIGTCMPHSLIHDPR